MSELKHKINTLPESSGVYLMIDKKGAIIYVGKAKNLKNRVSSYFQSQNQHSIKTKALVGEIYDLDLMLVNNEVEALLLERTLIRHHQPHFNILLKDDKDYPYLRINYKDPWPRILKVRKRKNDGAKYIGPFSSSFKLSTILNHLYKIFPLIRCSEQEFKMAKRPCNYYHMKMCLGPCTLPVDRDYYISIVKNAASLLEGNISKLTKEIEKKMKAAALEENYEKAALLRDQLKALEHLAEPQVAVLKQMHEADVISMVKENDKCSFNVTIVRDFNMSDSNHFITEESAGSLRDELSSFILQYYLQREPPSLIIIKDCSETEISLSKALEKDNNKKITIRQPLSLEEKDLMEISEKNARHYLESEQNKKLNDLITLDLLQNLLHLKKSPIRIECIDISNLQSTAVVASDVCFINGRPAKKYYRRYEIKSLNETHDDFKSMQEVVKRRIERGIRDDDLPDLLVIDGGRPQVRAVMEVLDAYPQLGLAIVGLAKSRLDKGARKDDIGSVAFSKERLVLPDQEKAIELEEGSSVFRLMTSIRDEAHRFAITYHRKKRDKISSKSFLDDIKGVGPSLKKRLLIEYKTIDRLRELSLEELKKIKGVSEATALNIFSALHR